MLEHTNNGLHIFVQGDWRTIIQAEDVEYVESLLRDFRERVELDSDALFRQLSSLGVGPLVARQTGRHLSEHPALLELCSRFVRL